MGYKLLKPCENKQNADKIYLVYLLTKIVFFECSCGSLCGSSHNYLHMEWKWHQNI